MAPHSSNFAQKIPWTEEPGRLQSRGSLELDTTERLHFHFSLSCIGEGNGNPLQCSCLENPRAGGAWWVAVYGVTQSRTRLKQLSSSSKLFLVSIVYLVFSGFNFSKRNLKLKCRILQFTQGEKCPNPNALIKKQWPKTNEVSGVSIKFYLSKEKSLLRI